MENLNFWYPSSTFSVSTFKNGYKPNSTEPNLASTIRELWASLTWQKLQRLKSSKLVAVVDQVKMKVLERQTSVYLKLYCSEEATSMWSSFFWHPQTGSDSVLWFEKAIVLWWGQILGRRPRAASCSSSVFGRFGVFPVLWWRSSWCKVESPNLWNSSLFFKLQW